MLSSICGGKRTDNIFSLDCQDKVSNQDTSSDSTDDVSGQHSNIFGGNATTVSALVNIFIPP